MNRTDINKLIRTTENKEILLLLKLNTCKITKNIKRIYVLENGIEVIDTLGRNWVLPDIENLYFNDDYNMIMYDYTNM